jgi:tetratricopeptide (TPR) repeat protein
MTSSDAPNRSHRRNVARRGMGLTGTRRESIISTGLLVVLFSAAPARLPAQDQDEWKGNRVVSKHREFVLRLDDEPVETSRKAIVIYRVDRADGPLLWLKAEGRRVSGSTRAEDVILVERAVDYFNERVRAHPHDAFAHAMLGLVEQDRKAFDAALRDYDLAVGLDPANPLLYLKRGDVRLALNEYDRAITDYNEAIRLDPKPALAFCARGTAWVLKKDHDRAIEDLSEAIWLDPLFIPAYRARGGEWQARAEYEKAIVDYNMVIRLDPENAAAYAWRARAWTSLEAYAKAIADYDRAIRIDSQDPTSHERLAWILATCPVAAVRDGKKAVEAAARACELTRWLVPLQVLILG